MGGHGYDAGRSFPNKSVWTTNMSPGARKEGNGNIMKPLERMGGKYGQSPTQKTMKSDPRRGMKNRISIRKRSLLVWVLVKPNRKQITEEEGIGWKNTLLRIPRPGGRQNSKRGTVTKSLI